jgi:cell division protease FtsH
MDKKLPDKRFKFSLGYLFALFLVLTLVQQSIIAPLTAKTTELSYSEFKAAVRTGQVDSVSIGEDRISGTFHQAEAAADEQVAEPQQFFTIRVEDPDLLAELEAQAVEVQGELPSSNILLTILGWMFPLILIFAFYYWMMKRMRGGSGGGLGDVFSMGKSKARVIQGEQTQVSFQDVGGAGEAVTELREVTEFLKNPDFFQRLGGKMPKGVLLVGPPGTGKTLLARATAGEAGVPFYSLSGAEFVEMFVGVGASRVRDLFEQAKKSAPSIIFIDEIDAIGGQRAGAGAIRANEEREQTLNQLLAEMDGFESTRGVVVMAATNRPEVLDTALLRPGRFDRQITVDLPDLAGREQILSVHVRNVTLAQDVNLAAIARITPGFSGADLENVINQAALLAARHQKEAVEMTDFDEAIERVIAGSERRTRVMRPEEKEKVAFHEAGHALVASLIPGTDPVHKVTIVPRGRALGYTWQRPSEDRYLLSEEELHAQLAILLGGRVAEALVFSEVSTGATDDLTRATDLARRMVTEYGMSPALGPVRLAGDPQAPYLGDRVGLDARVSPQTAALVDRETRRIVEDALSLAWELLESHRPALEELAARLCENETVDGHQLSRIVAAVLDQAVDQTMKKEPLCQ